METGDRGEMDGREGETDDTEIERRRGQRESVCERGTTTQTEKTERQRQRGVGKKDGY